MQTWYAQESFGLAFFAKRRAVSKIVCDVARKVCFTKGRLLLGVIRSLISSLLFGKLGTIWLPKESYKHLKACFLSSLPQSADLFKKKTICQWEGFPSFWVTHPLGRELVLCQALESGVQKWTRMGFNGSRHRIQLFWWVLCKTKYTVY